MPHPRSLRFSAARLDIFVGVLMLAVALWFWVEAAAIESHSRGLMGPVAFPKGIALLLGGCSLAMIVRTLMHRPAHAVAAVNIERPWYVLAAMGMSIAYPLLVIWLNYYIATGLWLPAFLWIAGYRKPIGMLLCSIGFLIFTRVIFQLVLGIPMP